MNHVMITWSVKSVIADMTGLPKVELRLGHTLAGTYEFPVRSRRELASRLNSAFAQSGYAIPGGLSPAETESAQSVRDLVLMIRRKFGV